MQLKQILSTLLFLIPVAVNAQLSDFSSYFESDFAPKELNRNQSEYLKDLLKKYKEDFGNSSKIDEKQFVYSNNFYLDNLNRSGRIYYGDSIGQYLNELKDFILDDPEERKRIKVYLMDDYTLNAFTNDFGGVYIHMGTLARLESEEELLFVIAHEISHVLLQHSRSKEIYNNENWTYTSSGWQSSGALGYSREKEIEADKKAMSLLEDKLDFATLDSVFIRLEGAANPIFREPPSFSSLTFEHERTSFLLDSLFNLEENSKSVTLPKSEEIESTHPSLDLRQKYLVNRIDSLSETVYQPTGKFPLYRGLAHQLLIRTCLISNLNFEGLYLVAQLREKSPNDPFLIHAQLRFLTLLAQEKYGNDIWSHYIGFYGESCTDDSFLRMKRLFIKLSNTDANLIAYLSVNKAIDTYRLDHKSDKARRAAFQIMYLNNPDIVQEKEGYYFFNPKTKKGAIRNYSDIDEEVRENLRDKLVFVAPYQTDFLTRELDSTGVIDEELSSWIDEIKTKEESNLSAVKFAKRNEDSESLILSAAEGARKYKRGTFLKSPDFDPNKRAALVNSTIIYYKSRDKYYRFQLDYPEMIELISTYNDLVSNDTANYINFSNQSTKKITVKDNFIHSVMNKWMTEQLKEGVHVYSSVQDELDDYFETSETVDYLILNLVMVNRNKGKGRLNNAVFYQVYIDVKTGVPVYFSAIGSQEKMDRYRLKHFLYLNDYHKNNE